MTINKQQILTPFDIGRVSLKNRFAVAPMTRVSASEEGLATQRQVDYYERFAKGGFGLTITEGIYIDQKFSQGYLFQPGITDLEQAQAWRAVTSAVHKHEGKIFAQLMHAGALSQGNRFSQVTTGPSAVLPKGEQMGFYYGNGQYAVPETMSEEDIADAIDGFAKSAQRALEVSGFDGIEIHGANGYLLDQFLTAVSNQRTDKWGGDVQHRVRLILEVYKAVRNAVGNATVGVRISQGKVNDFFHKWAEGEAAAEVVFGSLADAGVDFIHVTEFEAWKPAFAEGGDSFVKLARRHAPDQAIITNGGLHQVEHIEDVLQAGADIIALGKGALANPDFPNRFASGKSLVDFDPSILGPVADIKDSELG
ncbi:N-ethylmaleimide reductase [Pseudomonas fluorescens]|nr:N-ethylmaleimide reductase [Pseudomonas fluorescens]